MKFLSFSLLLILISCSPLPVRQNNGDLAYRTSGIEQYFLPELPSWANSSPLGQCFKKHSFQYLDFKKLSKAYELKYSELLELQAQYNERLEAYYRSASVKFLKPVEEATFFSHVLENIKAGVKSFDLPVTSKKIDVIWLDQYIALDKVNELKKMNQMGLFDEVIPVLFSSCLSKQDLSQWLMENNLDQEGFYSLTAEWLTPFGADLQIRPGLQLEIKKIIDSQVEVRFVAPKEMLQPNEIVL